MKNKHHLIPKSRIRREICLLKGITIRIDVNLHKWYHRQFGNLTPIEIFDWLNETFWGNNYEIKMKGEDK